MTNFQHRRHGVGNCIGNLHVLESSLNRSLGDAALATKLKLPPKEWKHEDCLLYHDNDEHKKMWQEASSDGENVAHKTWDEPRLQAFQGAVYVRALGLYRQYAEACEHTMSKTIQA